jgi:hypothetical protein
MAETKQSGRTVLCTFKDHVTALGSCFAEFEFCGVFSTTILNRARFFRSQTYGEHESNPNLQKASAWVHVKFLSQTQHGHAFVFDAKSSSGCSTKVECKMLDATDICNPRVITSECHTHLCPHCRAVTEIGMLMVTTGKDGIYRVLEIEPSGASDFVSILRAPDSANPKPVVNGDAFVSIGLLCVDGCNREDPDGFEGDTADNVVAEITLDAGLTSPLEISIAPLPPLSSSHAAPQSKQ